MFQVFSRNQCVLEGFHGLFGGASGGLKGIPRRLKSVILERIRWSKSRFAGRWEFHEGSKGVPDYVPGGPIGFLGVSGGLRSFRWSQKVLGS